MSFNLPSERTESSSSMAQSDDKSVCHSAVEQLIEAVNRLVPLHTVSVNSRQFLIDCFTPIMIEALAVRPHSCLLVVFIPLRIFFQLAHGIAMKTSRKKLDSLEKKQADLLEENREKTKRLLELENLLKSYGNQAQYVPTEVS